VAKKQFYTKKKKGLRKRRNQIKAILHEGTMLLVQRRSDQLPDFRILQLTEVAFAAEALCRKGGTDRQTRGSTPVPGGADNGNVTSARGTQLQTSSANLNFHVGGTASPLGRVGKPQNRFDTLVLLIYLLYTAGGEAAVLAVPVPVPVPVPEARACAHPELCCEATRQGRYVHVNTLNYAAQQRVKDDMCM
jgi:hypothetical protein